MLGGCKLSFAIELWHPIFFCRAHRGFNPVVCHVRCHSPDGPGKRYLQLEVLWASAGKMLFATRYESRVLKEVTSSHNTTDAPHAVCSACYLFIYPIAEPLLLHFYKAMFEYWLICRLLKCGSLGCLSTFNLAVETSLTWLVSKAKDGANFRLFIVENVRLSLPNLAKRTMRQLGLCAVRHPQQCLHWAVNSIVLRAWYYYYFF